MFSILTQRGIKENADYDDMAGPILVVILFGLILLMVNFKYYPFRKEKFSLDIFMATDCPGALQ